MKVFVQLQADGFLSSWETTPAEGAIELEVDSIDEVVHLSMAHKYQDGQFIQDPERLAEIVEAENAVFQNSETVDIQKEFQEVKNRIESTDAALMDFILMIL